MRTKGRRTVISFRGEDAEYLMPALREVEVKRMRKRVGTKEEDIDKAKRALIRLQDVPSQGWSGLECELLGEALDALFHGEKGRAEYSKLRSEMGLGL